MTSLPVVGESTADDSGDGEAELDHSETAVPNETCLDNLPVTSLVGAAAFDSLTIDNVEPVCSSELS